MRISILEGDPGYRLPPELISYAIYLDGVQQWYVITADDEQGFVLRYKTDAQGQLISKDDFLIEERVEGSVVISKDGILSDAQIRRMKAHALSRGRKSVDGFRSAMRRLSA